MNVLRTKKGQGTCFSGEHPSLQIRNRAVTLGLMLCIAAPIGGQEQMFAYSNDEIVHLTPASRLLDFNQFQASLGAFKPLLPSTEFFYFDNVLLPASSWLDEDPDTAAKRHLATASDIRHSVLPQTNPRGTISLLLKGNGETALDSEGGQSGFRSNGPALPDSSIPE